MFRSACGWYCFKGKPVAGFGVKPFGNIQLSGGTAQYALYPVWLLNTTWNQKKYTFAMNGQTGKFVGDLPVDKAAATRWTLGLTVLLGAAAYGVIFLLHLFGIL